jgi:inner membrane protein
MTWVSHILVGSSAGHIAGYGYALSAFGSVLPDLLEYVLPVKHRGISHSLIMWFILSVILWLTGIEQAKAVVIGVLFGHLLMDSLTITGVPVYDEKGRYVTLFGGKLRTGTAMEYAISISIAVVTFLVFGIGQPQGKASIERMHWKELYNDGIIDKREYRENRFKLL